MQPEQYRVLVPYRSAYPDPILFQKGEKIRIGREFSGDPDWKDWIWCEGENRNTAWVPKQFIDGNGFCRRAYNARELTILTGEILTVTEIVNGFGWAQKADGQTGWVPMKNLEKLS